MIHFIPNSGVEESERPLLSPRDAAHLTRAFASMLPEGGRVLLMENAGPRALRPALPACMAQLAFTGHPAVPLAGFPAMAHAIVPYGNFAGAICFSDTGCWFAGPDGRCLDDTAWQDLLARFDGDEPEDARPAVDCGEPEDALLTHYWDQLVRCGDAAAIRAAKLRIACCGLPDREKFGDLFGAEMLPFSCPEAAAGAMPYLKTHGGFVFDPSGKRLQLIGEDGTLYPPEAVMLLGSFIALEKGEKDLVSGGFASRDWTGLLLKHALAPAIVPSGEGHVITAGCVCGDLDGHFSFGGYAGYDALRSAAYILEFLAAGGSIHDTMNRLLHHHALRARLNGGAAALPRLKGRFNAEQTLEYDGGFMFDFADGRLSAAPLADDGVLIFSEAKKLQDARSRLETARTFLAENAK